MFVVPWLLSFSSTSGTVSTVSHFCSFVLSLRLLHLIIFNFYSLVWCDSWFLSSPHFSQSSIVHFFYLFRGCCPWPSTLLCLFRHPNPYMVCLGPKNVLGPWSLVSPGADAEGSVSPWRSSRRKRQQKEGKRKNATTNHFQGCRWIGTGCCLYGGPDALFSSPRT